MSYWKSLQMGAGLGLAGSVILGGLLYLVWFAGQPLTLREVVSRIRDYVALTAVPTTAAGAMTGLLTCLLLQGHAHGTTAIVAGALIGAVSGLALGATLGFTATVLVCLAAGANGQSPMAGMFVGAICAAINLVVGVPIGILVARSLPGV